MMWTTIGLFGIIAVLLAERVWDRRRMMNMQDMMNRAFLAKSVPEYESTAKAGIQKLKLENENAIAAAKILENQVGKEEDGIPIS